MKSSFFEDVYEVTRMIPVGRVTSYGAIANYLGLKSSARMVGYALNSAHVDKTIPAHRVVNRNGLLSGKFHFEYPEQMQELLAAEGVEVENDKVLDFSAKFWDPQTSLI